MKKNEGHNYVSHILSEHVHSEKSLEAKTMTQRIPLLLLGTLLLSSTASAASDDMQEKIRLLEQQIRELKELKARQDVGKQKIAECLKAVGREKFCACVGDSLPAAVSFEQYIHTMVSSKEDLGYSTMPAEQKQLVDNTLKTGEKCVEKGFFK